MKPTFGGHGISGVRLIVFSLIPTMVLLAGLEVGLRIYALHIAESDRGKALPQPAQRHDYQREDPVLGYSLKPGYVGKGIRVNQLGYRGSEISQEKPRGVFRIVAIGDSNTFGLAGESCPYPVQLETILNAGGGAQKFQVINAGVEGYSSIYALRLLETRIKDLEPDVVMIYVGWNDLYSYWPFRPNIPNPYQLTSSRTLSDEEQGVSARLRAYLDHLYLVQFLRRVIYKGMPRVLAYVQHDTEGPGRQPDPHMADLYKYRLEMMIDQIKSMGAKPVLMTLPTVVSLNMSEKAFSFVHYPTWAKGNYKTFYFVIQAYNDVIHEVANEQHVPLIDNAKFFDRLGKQKDQLFFDSLHMYCPGYELLAQNIGVELKKDKLLMSSQKQ